MPRLREDANDSPDGPASVVDSWQPRFRLSPEPKRLITAPITLIGSAAQGSICRYGRFMASALLKPLRAWPVHHVKTLPLLTTLRWYYHHRMRRNAIVCDGLRKAPDHAKVLSDNRLLSQSAVLRARLLTARFKIRVLVGEVRGPERAAFVRG